MLHVSLTVPVHWTTNHLKRMTSVKDFGSHDALQTKVNVFLKAQTVDIYMYFIDAKLENYTKWVTFIGGKRNW